MTWPVAIFRYWLITRFPITIQPTHGGPPIHPNGAEIKHCLGPAMTAMFAVEPEPDNAGVGIELGLQNGIMDDSLPPSSLCRSLRRASLEISTDCGCVSNPMC